jgi:hypothetical protein
MEYRVGMTSQRPEVLTSASELFFSLFSSQPQSMKSQVKIIQYLNLSFRLLKVPSMDKRLRSTFSIINSIFFSAVKSYAKFCIPKYL